MGCHPALRQRMQHSLRSCLHPSGQGPRASGGQTAQECGLEPGHRAAGVPLRAIRQEQHQDSEGHDLPRLPGWASPTLPGTLRGAEPTDLTQTHRHWAASRMQAKCRMGADTSALLWAASRLQAECRMSAETCRRQVDGCMGVALIGWRLLYCHAGASDLERPDPGEGQASKYAILLADTYLVGDGPPAQLTNACPRSWSDAAYFFKARPRAPQAMHSQAEGAAPCST